MSSILFALIAWVQIACASNAGVSPAWVDGKLVAGRNNTFAITVQNNSNGVLTFESSLQDLWYDQQTMRPVYPPAGTTPSSAVPFMQIFPTRHVVEARGSAEFMVTVAAPEVLEQGMYATAILYSRPYVPEGIETLRAQTAIKFLVPLLLNPATGSDPSYELLNQGALAPNDQGVGRLRVELRNTGSVHSRPMLRAIVRERATGAVVSTIVKGTDKFYLPGQRRISEFEWTQAVAPGDYDVIGAVQVTETDVLPFQLAVTIPDAPAAPEAEPAAEPAPTPDVNEASP